MLLAYLALNRTRAVPRSELVGALWGETPPADPGASLRAHLSRLRTALGEGVLEGASELRLRPPSHAVIDVEVASAALAEAEDRFRTQSWERCLTSARAALGVLEHPLLPSLAADWIDSEARHLEAGALRALELVAGAALELDQPDGAGAELAARSLIERTPFREAGHRLLLRSLMEQGENAEALRAYDSARTLFREELGAVPGSELRRLHGAALGREEERIGDPDQPSGWRLPDRLVAPPPPGRSRELAWLRQQVRAGGEAAIEGEGGIGKTRLIAALASELASDGWGVLYGRCRPVGAIPYEPFVEALEGALVARGAGDLEQKARDAGPEVAPLVPMLSLEDPGAPAGPADAGTAIWRLHRAAVRLLDALATERPLLFAIDDLQSAGSASLALLHHLGECCGERVAVLSAHRIDDPSLEPAIVDRADRLRSSGRLLRLEGLEPAALAEIGSVPGGASVSSETATALHRVTGGNPLYATQLVRHAIDSGVDLEDWRGPDAVQDIPSAVRELVARRVARLEQPAQSILKTASIIGQEFEMGTLSSAAGIGEQRLLASLEQACGAGLVEEIGDSERFAFVHGLVHRALYEDQLAARLHEGHRAVAAVLEAEPEVDPARLALHWHGAGPRGDPQKVVRYSRESATRAAAGLAHAEAARHYRRALEAGEGRLGTGSEMELLLALARSEANAGDLESGRQAARRAAWRAREARDWERLGRAALTFSATGGSTALDAYQMDFAREASELLVEAEDALPATDTALRGRVLSALAGQRLSGLALDRRRSLADEASTMARRLADAPGELTALRARTSPGLRGPYDLEQAIEAGRRAADLAAALGDAPAAFDAHRLLAAAYFELGEIDSMDRELSALEHAAAGTGAVTHTLDLAAMRAGRASFAGRLDEANEIRLNAIAAAPDKQAAGARFASHQFHGPWLRGRYEEAIATVEAVVAMAPQALPLHGLLALLYLETGAIEPARERFERVARDGFAFEPDEFLLIGLTQTALACSYLGDAERALSLHERLIGFESRNAAIGEQAVSNGPVALHLGALEVTLGRFGEAKRHLDLAERLAREWGHAGGVADALLHRGQLEALQGGDGSALIDRALAHAEAHGIARVASTAEALTAYWPAPTRSRG